MTGNPFAYGLLAALAILLLVTVYTDIKDRKIYNKIVLPIAIGAPLWWIANGEPVWPDMALHLITGVIVFLLFSLFFYLRAMGGGDVKLFTAMALWFDWTTTTRMLFYTAILGAIVTVVFWMEHRFAKRQGFAQIPYGVAIAIAGLIICSERYFNQYG
ncbi:A24 family peptidase [Novosphingopyxis iocasae]|uniref:A24 family peptidase n=1 Tax=Novosphingopyxis iocasae TaxID=2762729 RepID=UPI001650FB6A|nr:prepilin peptidase [Novosphingopyxis iocasae]